MQLRRPREAALRRPQQLQRGVVLAVEHARVGKQEEHLKVVGRALVRPLAPLDRVGGETHAQLGAAHAGAQRGDLDGLVEDAGGLLELLERLLPLLLLLRRDAAVERLLEVFDLAVQRACARA